MCACLFYMRPNMRPKNKGRYIMGIIELLLLAIGLSMDAFAVSVCKGLAMGKVKPQHMLICGAWFGGFQALMQMIGYLLGSAFENIISAVSSWIAFGLLVLIIGVTTCAISCAGVKVGGVFGTKYKTKSEVAGGVLLILIGVKILLEHFGVL